MMETVIDQKVSTRQLEKNGFTKGGIEYIPPSALTEKTQANMRSERRIPYFKIAGRVYYNGSDLIKWAEKQKINAVL